MTSLGSGEKVNIDVSCRREHRLQGSSGSENHELSKQQSRGVESAPWGSTFVDACDFFGDN